MKNSSFYSLLFSILGVILFIIFHYLGNVTGDLTPTREFATIVAMIGSLICFIVSIITEFIGYKNKENKRLLRLSGIFITLLFILSLIIFAILVISTF